jgi:hypothetical protein
MDGFHYSFIIHLLFSALNKSLAGTSMTSISDVQAALLEIIGSAPANGLSAAQIQEQLTARGIDISQPTLSRRLDELQSE